MARPPSRRANARAMGLWIRNRAFWRRVRRRAASSARRLAPKLYGAYGGSAAAWAQTPHDTYSPNWNALTFDTLHPPFSGSHQATGDVMPERNGQTFSGLTLASAHVQVWQTRQHQRRRRRQITSKTTRRNKKPTAARHS